MQLAPLALVPLAAAAQTFWGYLFSQLSEIQSSSNVQVAPLALVPLAAAAQLLTLIPLPLTVAQFSEAQSASALQLAPH